MNNYVAKRIFIGVCIGVTMMVVNKCARAQAGTSQWGSWTTVRTGGQAVTNMYPAGGVPFGPGSYNAPPLPSSVGGTAVGRSAPLSVAVSKPVSFPFSSGVGGGTQTVTATLQRTVLKQPLITAAAKVSRLTSPIGWGIMAGTAILPYMQFSNGMLKTSLKEEGSVTGYNYGCGENYGGCPGGVSGLPANDPTPQAWCTRPGLMQAAADNYRPVFHGTVASGANYVCEYKDSDGGSILGMFVAYKGQVEVSSSGCPSGYTQGVNFFNNGWRCQPNTISGAPFDHSVTDAEMAVLLDNLVGSDPVKLAQLFTDLANVDPYPSNVTNPGVYPPSETATTAGPATLPPTTTTTPTSNPTGTRETTITPGVNYNNTTITITENVVNNYYDENNVLIGSDTTPPEVVAGASDSTLPAVVDFYTQKYPNGFGGVWAQKSAAMQANAFTGLISALTPSLASTGTCPAWNIGDLLGLSFGELKPPCFIWDVIKVIFVVTALFMARRIIFGG